MRTFGPNDLLFILAAARWTLALSLIAFVGSAVGGLAVALSRTSELRWLRNASAAFIQLFQGTPLLLQLFLIFFGAPVLGFDINPWVAAGVALVLNTSAFLGQIWRGCIEAIPRGQREAADALSLSYRDRMRDVILPQAVRIAVAPTVGYMVQIINNATFQPLLVFSAVAAIYFVLCWPLSLAAAAIERRHRRALAR